MPRELRRILNLLVQDETRRRHPFTEAFAKVQAEILSPACSDSQAGSILTDWLATQQPCLFGRIAARNSQLSYCLLTEADLADSDQLVLDKIHRARLEWLQLGYEGKRSGFVIHVRSTKLAECRPDSNLMTLACRLASLYLNTEVVADAVYHDNIFLAAGAFPAVWQWKVGANFFGSAGDGRWWNDHRIPGGIAFSMNSVGHMSKCGTLSKSLASFNKGLGIEDDVELADKVDSLQKAHVLAMRTIQHASVTPSGPATHLQPLATDVSCPIELPQSLVGWDPTTYCGWYHTDCTVPSLYFKDDVDRPTECTEYDLDFGYLFDSSIDNPDYRTIGEGIRVRADYPVGPPALAPLPGDKTSRAIGTLTSAELYSDLKEAIQRES